MKRKVLAYITRMRNGHAELLVHKHRDFPEAGIQVPAGTVEEHETEYQAVLREIAEESGILHLDFVEHIATYSYYSVEKNQWHSRNVFSFEENTGHPLPDTWEHLISSNGEDDGLVFHYYWLPLYQTIELAGNQGDYLTKLKHQAP